MTPAAESEIVIGRMKTLRNRPDPRGVFHTRIAIGNEMPSTSVGKTISQIALFKVAFQKSALANVAV